MCMSLAKEEHANQYHLLELESKDVLRGIAILGQGRLPQELFPDTHMISMLCEVQTMVKKMYPDYQLVADHISCYRDMKLVTFVVDRKMPVLVVSFPDFVKDYGKSSLPIECRFFILLNNDVSNPYSITELK